MCIKAHRNRETGYNQFLINRLSLPFFMRIAILLIEQVTCSLPQTTKTSQSTVIAGSKEFALQNCFFNDISHL